MSECMLNCNPIPHRVDEHLHSDALRTYSEPPTTMSLSSFRDSWHPSQNVNRYFTLTRHHCSWIHSPHTHEERICLGAVQKPTVCHYHSSSRLLRQSPQTNYSYLTIKRTKFKKTHNKVSMLPVSDGNPSG